MLYDNLSFTDFDLKFKISTRLYIYKLCVPGANSGTHFKRTKFQFFSQNISGKIPFLKKCTEFRKYFQNIKSESDNNYEL